MTSSDYVYLYDSTLRDGAQARGVDFSVADKQAIARELDRLGIDYIEGGWPGANPVDDRFFEAPPELKHAQLSAFGMTRRSGRSAANDPALAALLDTKTPSICIVGKAWDFQVKEALEISPEENLKMIGDSVAYLAGKRRVGKSGAKEGIEVHFDAEHFFDGFKANPDYALTCAQWAYEAGARWVVLCDTNGGSLPEEIERIVKAVTKKIPGDHLGIHCHNDTENAVANSLAAVRAGARQVQGTINGVGERCGNANLISVIPALMLKMGLKTGVSEKKLERLTQVSRFLDDRLNRPANPHQPYVGAAAFAHKGGLHVSAMAKNTATYEHIPPESVGNTRQILVSDKAGRANVLTRLKELEIGVKKDDARVDALVKALKERESKGYSYEGAEASFEMLARDTLKPGSIPEYFELISFRVIDERRFNARQQIVTMSEATIKIRLGDEVIMTVAEGNGPVNALDAALRRSLLRVYPSLKDMTLTDYKVRILTPEEGTRAVTRVMIESRDGQGEIWRTVGVSGNVIDASFNALEESISYKLYKSGQRAKVIV